MADETRLGSNFTIDVTNLKAGLAQANRLIRESESEFKAAAAGMGDWSSSAEGVEARIKYLNDATDLQKKKVGALKEQYEKLVNDGLDPTSKEAVELRTQINKEQAALNKNEKELDEQTKALQEMGEASGEAADETKETADAAKKAGKATKEAGDGAEGAGKGFSALKSAAKVGAAAIAAVAAAAVAGVKALLDLAESTREYREDLNKLQTGFQTAGFSAEEATAAYQDLYAVIGESDRSVEAVNHLAKLVDTEKELSTWTGTILPGVWATFGDSLPLEGLTEAANETARVGEVTGVLADALNWSGISQESFQKKLDACNSESERASLITETLNGLYGEAAGKYKELNGSIMDANRAQAEFADAQADLGAAVEPLSTKLTELKTTLLTSLSPALKQIITDLTDVFDGVDGAPERLANTVSSMIGDIVAKAAEFMPRVAEFATQLVFMLAQTLIENLPELVDASAEMFTTFVNTLANMVPSLLATIVDTIFLVAETIIDNLDEIIDAGINLIDALIEGILDALPVLVSKIPVIIQKLFDAIMNNLPKILNAGVRLIVELGNGLMKAVPDLVAQLPQIIVNIVKGLLTDGIPALIDAGVQLLKGLFEGMLNPSVIWENIKKMGNSILSAVKSFFGIKSPSRLFREEVGEYLGEGMALGLADGFDDKIKGVNKAIVRSMDGLGVNIPVGVQNNGGALANAQSGGVVVNQYNTYTNSRGSRYELYKTKQATAAAVRLARGTV